jgi:hypothetical protein
MVNNDTIDNLLYFGYNDNYYKEFEPIADAALESMLYYL